MAAQELHDTARALVAEGKGILAAEAVLQHLTPPFGRACRTASGLLALSAALRLRQSLVAGIRAILGPTRA